MRPRLSAALLVVSFAAAARGQTIEITPVVGYRFGGGFRAGNTTGARGDLAEYGVDDAAAFGVHVGYGCRGTVEIEAMYSRQDTRATTDGLFRGVPGFDLALETWAVGGNYLFDEEDARVRPYVGMGLGVTRLLPEPARLRDETRFSASFAAGVKVWLGRHVGLRFEGRGLFAFLEGSDSTFCQTGQGCQVGVAGSGISQGDLRVGLALRF